MLTPWTRLDRNFNYLQSICLSLQMKDIVQSPTRVTLTTSKCLDGILTNSVLVCEALIKHLDFTDHAMVSSSLISWPEKDQPVTGTTSPPQFHFKLGKHRHVTT